MTVDDLRQRLHELDNGVLLAGSHKAGSGQFCVLEFAHAVRGQPHSDTPDDWPDMRPLHDGPWSSERARTEAMLRLLAALWDWRQWPAARRRAWTDRVVIETVRQIIAEVPGLTEAQRQGCRAVTTRQEAVAAARATGAAWAAGAAWVAWPAWAAAETSWAAEKAEKAESVLRRACAIWITAATETQDVHERRR